MPEIAKEAAKNLDGRKTWLGLALSQLAVIFNQVSMQFDADATSAPDWKLVISATVVLVGVMHKLKKGE